MDNDTWSIPETEMYVVELAGLPEDEHYRPTTFARAPKIDWVAVNSGAIKLVQFLIRQDRRSGMGDVALSERDCWGQWSLFREPIDVSADQITNGIHRLTAMRAQGVTHTVAIRLAGEAD